jgi:hypothetical protein
MGSIVFWALREEETDSLEVNEVRYVYDNDPLPTRLYGTASLEDSIGGSSS